MFPLCEDTEFRTKDGTTAYHSALRRGWPATIFPHPDRYERKVSDVSVIAMLLAAAVTALAIVFLFFTSQPKYLMTGIN